MGSSAIEEKEEEEEEEAVATQPISGTCKFCHRTDDGVINISLMVDVSTCQRKQFDKMLSII
jgi:hypothetical protein